MKRSVRMKWIHARTFTFTGVVVFTGLLTLGFVTQSCGSNSQPDSTNAAESTPQAATTNPSIGNQPTEAVTVAVSISEFAFQPDLISVDRGASVVWTNNDQSPHTATNSSGNTGEAFDSKRLEAGQAYSMTLTKSGTYTYKCSIHNYMTGTIVVK